MRNMGYRGRRGRYPGNGPFRDLPPYQRPGRLYGRGMGYGRGYGYYGAGYGRKYGSASLYNCARFPWLPRWWWTNPDTAGEYHVPPAASTEQRRKYLEDHMKLLEQEISEVRKRLEEVGSEKSGE